MSQADQYIYDCSIRTSSCSLPLETAQQKLSSSLNGRPNSLPLCCCHSISDQSRVLETPHDFHRSPIGIASISCGQGHTLLLTESDMVYGWGSNFQGQVLFNGPRTINLPTKLSTFVTISTTFGHSLALSSDGKLYGWGSNTYNQIDIAKCDSLPLTPINIPYNIKEIHGGSTYSFALTQDGNVIKWGKSNSFEVIEGLTNIVFLWVNRNSFITINDNSELFCFNSDNNCLNKLPLTQYIRQSQTFEKSLLLDNPFLFVIDFNGEVLKFNKGDDDVPFNNKPTKVPGLNNIVSISGYDGIYAAIDNNGKVFLWGWLSRLSDVYEDSEEPRCIEAFNNIEGISVGYNFLFAYNKNTVWAWGRNAKGQLGTGDLIDRPQPVKVFGSEILGSFHYPKQPLDRMFSGLIKLVYWEYINYLQKLFGNHPYTKARFYTKCGVSKIVAEYTKELLQFTKGGFNQSSCVHSIKHGLFLKDPQDLTLAENICGLQLRFSSYYKGSKVINSRIKKLYVYYDLVDHDPQLLSFFPSVEVVKLGGRSSFRRRSINLSHLSNLKSLELDYRFNVKQLPTSLVKLVLKHDDIVVTDLSYLTLLKELVMFSYAVPERILKNQILPQSIVRLELWTRSSVNVEISLLNLKELIFRYNVPTNITEQNFPSLKLIQLIKPDEDSLSDSPLSPTKLINQGLIKSVKLIKNEYLVELYCFPWWVQYSAKRCLIDIFRDYVVSFKS
ncbi:hypothetical protein P9112_013890 [Eukaryota sp. TZLM1-RC]